MGGSINLANIALGFDSSKITKGVDLTAGEMRKLNSIFQGSISNVDKYNAEMQILDKSRKTGALTADRLVQAEESLAKKYNMVNMEMNTNIRLTQKEIDLQDRLAMSTKKATAAQGGGGGMALVGRAGAYGMAALGGGAIVKNSIGSAADIQATTLAFEVMTKSASKANMVVSEMRKLDQQSPLGFAAIQQAGKGLIQYRIEAEKVVPLLRQLGDITMGDNEKFKLMAYALGQVKGAGRLMGQEARQMTDAGFNPLAQIADEMAKKLGGLADDYMPKLKKQMEDGKIPFIEVTRAIAAATSAGGTFHGMTQRINTETTKGAIANMRSEVGKLGASFGEMILPIANVGAGMVQFTASAVAFPFNKWNEWARGMNFDHLYKETQELTKHVELRKQIVELTQRQKDDQKRVAFSEERSDFNSQIQAIDDEYRKKIIGEEKFNEMKLRTALRGNEMIAGDRQKLEESLWKQSAIKAMEAFEKTAKEREKQTKAAKAKQKTEAVKLQTDVETMRKSALLPSQKLRGDFSEIERLQRGGLDFDSARRAKNEAFAKFQKDQNPNNISSTIAPALKAGSVEAYKFMLQQKDKLYEAAQEQKELTIQSLELAKQQLAATKDIPRLGLAKR